MRRIVSDRRQGRRGEGGILRTSKFHCNVGVSNRIYRGERKWTHDWKLLRLVAAFLVLQGANLGSDAELAVDPDILGHDGALLGKVQERLEAGDIAEAELFGSL